MVVAVLVHVEAGVGVVGAGVPGAGVGDGAVLGGGAEVLAGGGVDFDLSEGGVAVLLQDVAVLVADGIDVVEVVFMVNSQ